MEGDISAAPRQASDFYKNYCWASDAPVEGEAQAHTPAENEDLHLAGNDAFAPTASDPVKDGQAQIPAVNEDLQPTDSIEEGEFFNCAVNVNLHASVNEAHDPQEEGRFHGASDPQLEGQAYAVASASKQHAAPFDLPSAATSTTPFPMAAHTIASPSAFIPSTLAFPASSPSNQHRLHSAIIASSATPPLPPAIPVLHLHAANPHPRQSIPALAPFSSSTPSASPCSQWRDEVTTTSSATIYSIPPGSFSQLRAKASPWQPGKPTLPSILIGDMPTPLWQSGDIFPSSISMVLPQPRPPLAVGTYRVQPCSYCGHLPQYQHGFKCGPNLPPTSLTKHLEVFHLRGRSVSDQAQASRGQPIHHTPSDRIPTRPKFKMKKELELLLLQKENLDPG